jgi:hypothetical protein
MCHMTLLSLLKAIRYLTLKDNSVSHTIGNSVSHTDQLDMSHDPIEPLKAIQYKRCSFGYGIILFEERLISALFEQLIE